VAIPRVQATVALWTLGLESELVFVGDAGTTDASRPSRRTGVELAVYARPTSWLALDADLSFSRARFTDDDPAGPLIPGAVERVASAGVTIDSPETRFFGSARLRSFGSRALVEDGSVRSAPTRLVNLQAGWKVTRGTRLVLDVFNVFNTTASDIDYFYVSRLRGEPAEGIADVHTHPALPRAVRVGVAFEF
jgi:outer membrane receptor protein involved in Fe transport